ncbi:hypothetical protein [Gymnodinialimonas mytili]|uniref:hypothetical protein n=1 Tax=Gymnodinialimonas mytili TaxID=3126503 RepID=UPI0030EED590
MAGADFVITRRCQDLLIDAQFRLAGLVEDTCEAAQERFLHHLALRCEALGKCVPLRPDAGDVFVPGCKRRVARRARVGTMLQLLLDQRLKTVGKLEGRCGISGLFVAREEVLDLLERPPLPGLSSNELRKHLCINCVTTPWLVSNGFLKSEVALHPRTRKSIRLFRYDEIDRFLAEYETVGRLSHRLATKPPYVVKQLKHKGLKLLAVERNMSVIYRRRDLPNEFL